MAAPKGRVLMLLENNAYPNDTRVRSEAVGLAAAGYRVTVISPKATGQAAYDVIDGVTAYRYSGSPSKGGMVGFVWEYLHAMVATFFLTFKVLLRSGFDIIHAHNPPDTFVIIGGFYRLFGKRFVFDHHDLAPEMYRARFPDGPALVLRLLRGFEALTFRLSDLVISPNDSYRRVAIERGGVEPHRVAVVRNGPNLARVRCVDPDEGLRAKADFVLGYVGVMGTQDGIDYLLRALLHLR
ncbi:MAG: glycosyltransferase, partial [Gemmatimonadota bacterium]|nr:glycosyltransferase [Gemmatimonadota bacterium]